MVPRAFVPIWNGAFLFFEIIMQSKGKICKTNEEISYKNRRKRIFSKIYFNLINKFGFKYKISSLLSR